VSRSKNINTRSGLREFIIELDRMNELVKVEKTVDPKYEIAAIVSKLDKGKAVIFESIKNSKFKVVANVLGTRKRVALAIGSSEDRIDDRINHAVAKPFLTRSIETNPWSKSMKNLFQIPIVTHFEKDSGPYITSSLVFAKNQETGSQNLSTHRLLRTDETSLVIRMVEGRHLHKCYSYAKEHGEDLRVSIVIGSHPAISVASAYQAPYGQDEIQIANSLMDKRLVTTNAPFSGLQVPVESEILIEGRVLADKNDYDCMVEMLGTYDIRRLQPVIKIDRIYYNENPIYHDILPGYTEHRLLMGLPVESRIRTEVKNVVPTTKDVYLTEGGCNWLDAVIQIKKTLEGQPKNAILAAFAAHPSLKIAIVVDEDIDPRNPVQVEYAISTRSQADRDLVIIPGAKGSSLDPSSDQENLITTKLGIDATGSIFKDSKRFEIARIPGQEKMNLIEYF
jgi:2,5-furandicarboxylate decarboxylase 1